jgi:hypothetical protein
MVEGADEKREKEENTEEEHVDWRSLKKKKTSKMHVI